MQPATFLLAAVIIKVLLSLSLCVRFTVDIYKYIPERYNNRFFGQCTDGPETPSFIRWQPSLGCILPVPTLPWERLSPRAAGGPTPRCCFPLVPSTEGCGLCCRLVTSQVWSLMLSSAPQTLVQTAYCKVSLNRMTGCVQLFK